MIGLPVQGHDGPASVIELPSPARAWYRRKPGRFGGPSRICLFSFISPGVRLRSPGAQDPGRRFVRSGGAHAENPLGAEVSSPDKRVPVSFKLPGGSTARKGGSLSICLGRGAYHGQKGVDSMWAVRATLTAWLRPIERPHQGPNSASDPSPSDQWATGPGAAESCENCRFLEDCPEEYRQEAAGRCENWESGAT